ncbi:hypothetical protein J6590_025350 [Homalodisca vitripennis]|nr:hypothetical protein J6590_025350 [Homalodisca vitripennis]
MRHVDLQSGKYGVYKCSMIVRLKYVMQVVCDKAPADESESADVVWRAAVRVDPASQPFSADKVSEWPEATARATRLTEDNAIYRWRLESTVGRLADIFSGAAVRCVACSLPPPLPLPSPSLSHPSPLVLSSRRGISLKLFSDCLYAYLNPPGGNSPRTPVGVWLGILLGVSRNGDTARDGIPTFTDFSAAVASAVYGSGVRRVAVGQASKRMHAAHIPSHPSSASVAWSMLGVSRISSLTCPAADLHRAPVMENVLTLKRNLILQVRGSEVKSITHTNMPLTRVFLKFLNLVIGAKS